MTYAEAMEMIGKMERRSIWTYEESEALDVLKRAEKVMEAVESMHTDDIKRVENIVAGFPEYTPLAGYKCPGRVFKDKFLALLKAIRERKGKEKP